MLLQCTNKFHELLAHFGCYFGAATSFLLRRCRTSTRRLDLAGGFLHLVGNLLLSPAKATINLRLNALVSRHVIALDWRR